MEFERGDELTLDNNEVYVVVDYLIDSNKKYLYLINNDKKIGLVSVESGTLKTIESDSEYEKVFNILYEKNKTEIEEIMKS